MSTDKVRASLERIRQAAIQKTQAGLAQKRNQDIISKIREGINGPIVEEVSNAISKKVVDKFLTAFEESLSKVKSLSTQYPNAPRNKFNEIVLYPDGCRFMHVYPYGHGHAGYMVIEQPPQVRTILIAKPGKVKEELRHLPFPYVIFIVYFQVDGGVFRYGGLHLGFRLTPLKSIEDELMSSILPNTAMHNVCMGSYSGTASASPVEVAEDAIKHFWLSLFGDGFTTFKANGTIINKWADWAQLTLFDILKATFPSGMQLNALLQSNDRPLSPTAQRSLKDLIQGTWNKISAELTVEQATQLIRSCSQEILSRITDNLALQSQTGEV